MHRCRAGSMDGWPDRVNPGNRLYLKCKCGRRVLLAKYWPNQYGWNEWVTQHADVFTDFLLAHTHELSNHGVQDGLPFSLEYEIACKKTEL